MEIREVQEDDFARADYVGSHAFASGIREHNWRKDPNRPDHVTIGVWDESGLQAKAVILAYRVRFGSEVVIPMGGIAGVACLPAARGRGYVNAAMRASLERMRDDGQAVSCLFPFSFDFYRKFGWEWVGIHRSYRIESRHFRASGETEHVRQAHPEDRRRVEDCYRTFASRYRGMLERDVREWNAILDDTEKHHTFTFLYERDGQVEGYLTYREPSYKETRLREFVANTPRAWKGLLGLLRRHEMQTKRFVWNGPGDDPLWHWLMLWETGYKCEPRTMARVVDLKAALEAWRPDAEKRGSVTFGVRDVCAPWNDGVWRAEFEAGRVWTERVAAEPQVALSIQAFSQAFHGTPSLDEVRSAGHAEVHDDAGYTALRALLQGPPMWMNNAF